MAGSGGSSWPLALPEFSSSSRLPLDAREDNGAAANEPISGAQLGQPNSKLRTGAPSAVVGVAARRSVAVAGRIGARSAWIRAIVRGIARRISVALLRVALLLRVARARVVLVRTTDDCKRRYCDNEADISHGDLLLGVNPRSCHTLHVPRDNA